MFNMYVIELPAFVLNVGIAGHATAEENSLNIFSASRLRKTAKKSHHLHAANGPESVPPSGSCH